MSTYLNIYIDNPERGHFIHLDDFSASTLYFAYFREYAPYGKLRELTKEIIYNLLEECADSIEDGDRKITSLKELAADLRDSDEIRSTVNEISELRMDQAILKEIIAYVKFLRRFVENYDGNRILIGVEANYEGENYAL